MKRKSYKSQWLETANTGDIEKAAQEILKDPRYVDNKESLEEIVVAIQGHIDYMDSLASKLGSYGLYPSDQAKAQQKRLFNTIMQILKEMRNLTNDNWQKRENPLLNNSYQEITDVSQKEYHILDHIEAIGYHIEKCRVGLEEAVGRYSQPLAKGRVASRGYQYKSGWQDSLAAGDLERAANDVLQDSRYLGEKENLEKYRAAIEDIQQEVDNMMDFTKSAGFYPLAAMHKTAEKMLNELMEIAIEVADFKYHDPRSTEAINKASEELNRIRIKVNDFFKDVEEPLRHFNLILFDLDKIDKILSEVTNWAWG